ncbi:MAG: hypothetical protein AAF799_41265 [Myxococcota bacterium]
MTQTLRTLLLTATFGGLGGLGLGCVISVGPLDCSECGNTGCDSQLVGGECVCDAGHEWVNPNDANDFECDEIPGRGGDASCGGDENNPVHLEGEVCVCDDGFNWCNPSDLSDLSCCEDPNQAPGETDAPLTTGDPMTSGTADTADDVDDTGADETAEPPGECTMEEAEWNGVEPNDADCTDDTFIFCSNVESEGPAGSRYWECMGGTWVENSGFPTVWCESEGRDFAYGCIDDGSGVAFVCGDGPGTPCSGPDCDACGDDGDQILFCQDNRLGGDSCLRICTEEGDADGITYDFGECVTTDEGATECACCDAGEEGCPA